MQIGGSQGRVSGDVGPEIGDRGSTTTRGIHSYSPEGYSITLFDSQGYDIGSDEQKFMRDVLGTIGDKVRENPDEMTGHIHEVWYCVSAANNRFFEADEKMIREIKNLTKKDLEQFMDAVKKQLETHLREVEASLNSLEIDDLYLFQADPGRPSSP